MECFGFVGKAKYPENSSSNTFSFLDEAFSVKQPHIVYWETSSDGYASSVKFNTG